MAGLESAASGFGGTPLVGSRGRKYFCVLSQRLLPPDRPTFAKSRREFFRLLRVPFVDYLDGKKLHCIDLLPRKMEWSFALAAVKPDKLLSCSLRCLNFGDPI